MSTAESSTPAPSTTTTSKGFQIRKEKCIHHPSLDITRICLESNCIAEEEHFLCIDCLSQGSLHQNHYSKSLQEVVNEKLTKANRNMKAIETELQNILERGRFMRELHMDNTEIVEKIKVMKERVVHHFQRIKDRVILRLDQSMNKMLWELNSVGSVFCSYSGLQQNATNHILDGINSLNTQLQGINKSAVQFRDLKYLPPQFELVEAKLFELQGSMSDFVSEEKCYTFESLESGISTKISCLEKEISNSLKKCFEEGIAYPPPSTPVSQMSELNTFDFTYYFNFQAQKFNVLEVRSMKPRQFTISPYWMGQDFRSVSFKGTIFACGGENSLHRCLLLELTTGNVGRMQDMKKGRSRHKLVAINFRAHLRIYALGGYNQGYLDSCERYSVEDNSWTLAPPLSQKKSGVGACCLETTQIWVFGGSNGHYLSRIEKLNLLEEEKGWVAFQINGPNSWGYGRTNCFAHQVSTKEILIFGGYNSGEGFSYLCSVFTLGTQNNKLEQLKTKIKYEAESYYYQNCTVYNGVLYAVGETQKGTYLYRYHINEHQFDDELIKVN